MYDYFTLGSVPNEEECAQVGRENYSEQARKEGKAFVNQLYRQFPDATEHNCRFAMKWFPHDFGSYMEVCVLYESNSENAQEFALYVENSCPGEWDEEARKELKLDEVEA